MECYHKKCFSLLLKSHRYWIKIVSNCLHPKTLLTSRFITFDKSLMSCRKSEVRFLASLCAEGHRTVVGKTLSRIASETSTSVNFSDTESCQEFFKVLWLPFERILANVTVARIIWIEKKISWTLKIWGKKTLMILSTFSARTDGLYN